MTKRLLLVSQSVAWVVAALICVTRVPSVGGVNCEPDCSAAKAGDMVEDPLDCTRYYFCLSDLRPADSPVSCPTGEQFDTTTSTCVPITTPPCEPSCKLPQCSLTCINDPGKIADPRSCNNYFVCLDNSVLGPRECPPDEPYFDNIMMDCSSSDINCCGNPCIPYCYASGTETYDPYDCNRYYICTSDGLADEETHFTCPSGSNFEVALGRCVVGAPCDPVCGDGGGTTTPSSGCQESMMCTTVGLFPMCPTCDKQYFNCRDVGKLATVETCPGSYVFNTDPTYPYCILPTACPQHRLYRVHHPRL